MRADMKLPAGATAGAFHNDFKPSLAAARRNRLKSGSASPIITGLAAIIARGAKALR
jgi:hypothetical protein